MCIYRLLITSDHFMGRTLAWVIGGSGP